MAVELSYCVVSTEQRQLLRYCLDAIARERAAVPFETEVLVLDNASGDGSAEAARAHAATTTAIATPRRVAPGESRTELLGRARGRFCLLLDADAELEPGATAALQAALDGDDRAAAAGAALVDEDGAPRPSAWRFPGIGAALLGVLGLHRRMVVQSRGDHVRTVDWCSPAALLVRRGAAAAAGELDPALVDTAHGADLGRRLRDAGWHVLYVPEARAVRHEEPLTGAEEVRAIAEHAGNRDRYLRKHHSAPAVGVVRVLTAARHAARALDALVTRRDGARAEARRALAALAPGRARR
jgi:N-acetylglucosaminyl-diphospho-decaprenol L-rhamnosyltransferase